jgi:hypothetical protein
MNLIKERLNVKGKRLKVKSEKGKARFQGVEGARFRGEKINGKGQRLKLEEPRDRGAEGKRLEAQG